VDLIELRKLIGLVEKSQIQELELEEEGRRIRISKLSSDVATSNPIPAMIPIPSAPAPIPAAPAPAPQESPESAGKPQAPAEKGTFIVAPMIGTFYRAPAPEAPPFVQVGDSVTPDTVVCIVEAMKVMNEIKAGMSGKVVDVLVENAQPVEFGQPLFRVSTG